MSFDNLCRLHCRQFQFNRLHLEKYFFLHVNSLNSNFRNIRIGQSDLDMDFGVVLMRVKNTDAPAGTKEFNANDGIFCTVVDTRTNPY